MTTTNYFEQGRHCMCCFVYSCANLALYLGKEDVPSLLEAREIANCRKLPPKIKGQLIKMFDLPLKEISGKDFEKVFETGGIITIHHPIWNIHACVIIPQENGRYTLLNSFLGPTYCPDLKKESIYNYIAKEGDRKHWVLEI